MKILNLYAGIGGNRKLWGDEHEITAVEIDPKIAKVYQDFFPNDKVIVTDAHQFLLDHYKEFDFIWSSPPCPTHSKINNSYVNNMQKLRYPDMRLYQEIIFLKHFFKGKWVVENVISYYEPLIVSQKSSGHYFWSNFNITNVKLKRNVGSMYGKYRRNWSGDKTQEERNMVNPKLGLHIFKSAFKIKQQTLTGEDLK